MLIENPSSRGRSKNEQGEYFPLDCCLFMDRFAQQRRAFASYKRLIFSRAKALSDIYNPYQMMERRCWACYAKRPKIPHEANVWRLSCGNDCSRFALPVPRRANIYDSRPFSLQSNSVSKFTDDPSVSLSRELGGKVKAKGLLELMGNRTCLQLPL